MYLYLYLYSDCLHITCPTRGRIEGGGVEEGRAHSVTSNESIRYPTTAERSLRSLEGACSSVVDDRAASLSFLRRSLVVRSMGAPAVLLLLATACWGAVDVVDLTDMFMATVTITPVRGGGGVSVAVDVAAEVAALERDAAAVGGEDCAAAAVGAATAAVAGAVVVPTLYTSGDSAWRGLAWGECPTAGVRHMLEDELRTGRRWSGSDCDFYGRLEGEQIAHCSTFHPDMLAVTKTVEPFGFIANAGGSGEGRWPLVGPPNNVIVCSAYSAATPLDDISRFVGHYIGRLSVTRVFMYDVGAARASVAAARGAVPLELRGRVTFARLAGAGSSGSALAAFQACFFSYGVAARWALYAEPHERAQLEPGMTLPEFVSLPRFAARDAIMLRVCGGCGAELDDTREGCALHRPLLRFGRVAIAGVRSACTARVDAVATAAGTPALLDVAACGDTARQLSGLEECESCRGMPHMCRSGDDTGGGGGAVVVGPVAEVAAAACDVRAVALVPRASVPTRAHRAEVPIQRGWAARPRTRAPRLAYVTMAFGNVASILPLLSFMLASVRGTGTAADLIVLVPSDDAVWTSHAGVAAALASAGARLWPMPMVEAPERCGQGGVGDHRSAGQTSTHAPGYFTPTYMQVHVAALAAYDAVAYIDALDVAVNGHVDGELAAFAAGHAVWSGRSDATPACPAGEMSGMQVRMLVAVVVHATRWCDCSCVYHARIMRVRLPVRCRSTRGYCLSAPAVHCTRTSWPRKLRTRAFDA